MNFFHKIPLAVFRLLYPAKFYGKENIPQGKVVIIANHFHAVDCGFIARVYNKDIYFLAKKELFENKFFGKIIKSFGAIPVDRKNPDMQSMLTCMRILKDEHKLVVFPEGTRNKTGTTELQPIMGGAMIFAVKAKSPIVPIIINNKPRIFRKTFVMIGKPFELDEFYGKKLTEETISELEVFVTAKMKELQQELFATIKKRKEKSKNKTK